jgi:DNA polymerase-3 subunit delta'
LVAREDQSKHSCKNRTSSTGNYNVALSLLHANEEHPFEQWFVTWVRAAFQAKKDASAIHDLILE